MIYDWKASGKRIKKLRKERNLSQSALSDEVGIHEKTIGKAERGELGLSVDNLLLLADYFGTSIDYLVIGAHQNDMNERLFALLTKMNDKQQEAACIILEKMLDFSSL